MEKEFIPYDSALELKKLGFDDHVFAFYWTDTKQLILDSPNYLGKHNGVHLQAPLWQQAFDWFREKYNLICYPVPCDFNRKDTKFDFIINGNMNYRCLSYEEVELECLKKLIEIVKEK